MAHGEARGGSRRCRVAGSLTAAALLRQSDSEVTVRLIDAAESTGRGDAFGTVDARHLTNVPVARMSADPDDPDDFLRWLRRRRIRWRCDRLRPTAMVRGVRGTSPVDGRRGLGRHPVPDQ